MLFCFRFEQDLSLAGKDISSFVKGEMHPVFFGAPYQVVAALLPNGLAGARLNEAGRAMAPSFTGWVEQVVAMLKMKAAMAAAKSCTLSPQGLCKRRAPILKSERHGKKAAHDWALERRKS